MAPAMTSSPSHRPSTQSAKHSGRQCQSRKGFVMSTLLALASFSSTALAQSPLITATAPASLALASTTLVLDRQIPQMTQPPWYDFKGPHELRRRDDPGTAIDSRDSGNKPESTSRDRNGDKDSNGGDDHDHSEGSTQSGAIKAQSTALPSQSVETVSSVPLSLTAGTISVAPTAATTSNAPLPSPFDGASSSSFSNGNDGDACPNFMKDLLEDPQFQSCYPLSMLVQVGETA